MNTYDVGIIGLGMAGVFATLKLAKEHKKIKVVGFDIGCAPQKRRVQMCGFFGLLPSGDGKLYASDIDKIIDITGLRRAKSANTYFKHVLAQVDDFKVIKDRSPSAAMEKKLNKFGYDMQLNDYTQMYPKQIHTLSKQIADTIETNKNITMFFNTEVIRITKQKNSFIISTEENEYRCKKLIMAVGRAGWRWAREIYANFGIIDSNDVARYGVRLELDAGYLKDFRSSSCTIKKNNDIEIGPLCWYGTIIPEDHVDMAISSFRGNETRWGSNKVSFSFIGNRSFPNGGFEQTDRLGKLTFVLANDRIIKERVSSILNGRSSISIIPEYDWLKAAIRDFANVVPEITTKAYAHMPTIIPMVPQINLGDNLSTDIDGMFVAGESAGVHGLLSAGLSGLIAADSVAK